MRVSRTENNQFSNNQLCIVDTLQLLRKWCKNLGILYTMYSGVVALRQFIG